MGKYEDATEQLQTAFDIQNELAPDDLTTLACRHHLANFLYKRKEYVEAHQHFDGLFHAEKRLNGPERIESVMSRCMMAFCLAKLRRYEEAQPHLERVSDHMKLQTCRTSDQLRDRGLVHYWLGRITIEHTVRHNNNNNYLLPKAAWLLQSARHDISTAMFEDKTNDWLMEDMEDCKYYQARLMLARGDFADAEQTLRQIIDDAPDAIGERQVGSRFVLASTFFKQRKLEEAKSILEEVVCPETPIEHCRHTGADLAACLALLGEAYLELQNPGKARDCLQHVVDVEPELPSVAYSTAQHALALSMFALRDFVGAFLDRVPKFGSKDDEKLYQNSRWLLGRGLYMKEEIYEACDYLRSSLTFLEEEYGYDNENTWFARAILADCLCELQLDSEALPLLTLAANHPDTKAYVDAVLIKAIGQYWLGRLAYRAFQSGSKRGKAAEEYFTAALSLLAAYKGNRIRWNRIRLDSRHFLARIKLRRGQHDEAASIFQELAKQAHESDELNHAVDNDYYLGFTLSQQSKFREALPSFQKILDGNQPGRVVENVRSWGQFQVGVCLYHTERFMDAKEKFELAAESPDTVLSRRARFRLGQSIYRIGGHEEAKDIFQSIIDKPDQSIPQFLDDVRCWLGKTLSKLEKPEVSPDTSQVTLTSSSNE
ncbi:hypothetical protein diail_4492 [Diaporthe ilicicola]|nr:hypothetical protein diail_4492 [Diaporthe ilicicola]